MTHLQRGLLHAVRLQQLDRFRCQLNRARPLALRYDEHGIGTTVNNWRATKTRPCTRSTSLHRRPASSDFLIPESSASAKNAAGCGPAARATARKAAASSALQQFDTASEWPPAFSACSQPGSRPGRRSRCRFACDTSGHLRVGGLPYHGGSPLDRSHRLTGQVSFGGGTPGGIASRY